MRHSIPLVILALATLSCQTATEPVPMLTVRAEVDRGEVPAGQTVWVDVLVTNETARPIDIPGFPMAMLEVRDVRGRVVAFGRYQIVTPIALPPRRLPPGGSATDRVPWTGDLEGDQVGHGSATPGRYEVRAAVALARIRRTIAYSAPITVVLTSP
jgi:hypothetical protein